MTEEAIGVKCCGCGKVCQRFYPKTGQAAGGGTMILDMGMGSQIFCESCAAHHPIVCSDCATVVGWFFPNMDRYLSEPPNGFPTEKLTAPCGERVCKECCDKCYADCKQRGEKCERRDTDGAGK